MALPKEKRYTYADLLEWEEGRFELYDGEAVALASPSILHQRISVEISTQLALFLRGKPCQVFSAPLDVRLFEKAGEPLEFTDTVVQPDILVVCDPGKLDRSGVRGAPDLVVEILSPATKYYDKRLKYQLYERAGVREYWIVDPDTRSVAVHVLTDGRFGSPDIFTAASKIPVSVLDGCEIDLALVFEE
ncbi:MAG: Uma2 family endonuclease [Oscillospiraceae bacterium]|nr:Uma2 family endonuclease [Oscillospiraceae bacterium]